MEDEEGKVDPPLPGSGGMSAVAPAAGDPPSADGDDTKAFGEAESTAPNSGEPEEVDPELPGSGG